MFKHLKKHFVWVLVCPIVLSPVSLRANPPALQEEPVPQVLSKAELEKVLAPIALYPDPLLAQILPASTLPGEIVLAHRYLVAKKDVAKIDEQPWDESVKALAHYPEVLKKMDQNLDWTTSLGEAFVAQPSDVFNTVQELRAKAQAAGNLKDSPQQVVVVEKEVIKIMPADPQVIYVPQYQPSVVYVEQPVYSAAPLITFGVGLAMGAWIHNEVNWHNHHVYYHNNGWNSVSHHGGNYYGGGNGNTVVRGGNTVNVNGDVNIGRGNGNSGSVWRPQTKPGNRPTYGQGNVNKGLPGGNHANNGSKWPNNRNGSGAGNVHPGFGNATGKPAQLPATGNNRLANTGSNAQQRPATLPGNTGQALQRPGAKTTQPSPRPNLQANPALREGTKQNRFQPGATRQAPSRQGGSGGGGGGGRFQR